MMAFRSCLFLPLNRSYPRRPAAARPSTADARPLRRRAAIALLLVLAGPSILPAGAAAGLPPGESFVPPANLQAGEPLLALIARMARLSPTFRAQCDRIARTRGLVVRLRYAGERDGRPYHARTVIRRYEFGAVIADVDLYVPLDPVEIVAHELEHVVEQIEGTDLQTLVRLKDSGVVRTPAGDFETTRAVAAGRRVQLECGGSDRESLTVDE